MAKRSQAPAARAPRAVTVAAWWTPATLAAVAAIAAGCSLPSEELPRPGSCHPFQLTEVSPGADSQNVSSDVILVARFNDFPDPATVNNGTFLLYTGFYYHTGRYWVDLVERRALFKASGDLRAGLGYTAVVRPNVRSLRGCLLQPPSAGPEGNGEALAEYSYRFQVVADGAPRPPTPVRPPPATFSRVVAVFADHCAGGGCHLATPPPVAGAVPATASPGDLCLTAPGGGLSLCARDARAALVGVPSRQVGPLVLVAARDSSRSYLLRKIIGAPPVIGHTGVPGDTLSQDDKLLLQDWIDRGAPGPIPGSPSPTPPDAGPSAAEAGDGGV